MSIFFPFYNEVDNVELTVKQALEVLQLVSSDFEIILVNDGSTDGTAEIIDELAGRESSIKTVHHTARSGYGLALRSGIAAASKDWVFYTDGDGQFDLSQLPMILKYAGEYDIISCYRKNRQDGIIRLINSLCWGLAIRVGLSLRVRDVNCAFKLFRRSIFDRIPIMSTGALVDAEILARARGAGYSMLQLPVDHYPRAFGRPTGANVFVILRAIKELLLLRQDILIGQNMIPKGDSSAPCEARCRPWLC